MLVKPSTENDFIKAVLKLFKHLLALKVLLLVVFKLQSSIDLKNRNFRSKSPKILLLLNYESKTHFLLSPKKVKTLPPKGQNTILKVAKSPGFWVHFRSTRYNFDLSKVGSFKLRPSFGVQSQVFSQGSKSGPFLGYFHLRVQSRAFF